MATLVTIYWLCFGVGLVYVLLSGALGAIGHGLAGAHAGDAPHDGLALGGLDAADGGLDGTGGFDTHGDLAAADLDGGADHGHAGHAHAGHVAALDVHSSGMPEYSPFSLLSLMGTLAGFGAGGLLATYFELPLALGLASAAGGALVMGAALWLIIGKLLYSLHASSEAHTADMIGLEAEVLTPIEHDMSGEIAYVLDGTRYTAPARLAHRGRVGKSERVRIRRVAENLVYVEERKRLLS